MTARQILSITNCLGLTKLKMAHNEMNRVEDSEQIPGIPLSIDSLDVTKHKFTRHLLDSCIIRHTTCGWNIDESHIGIPWRWLERK